MEKATRTKVSILTDDLWYKHYKPLNLDQDYLWHTDKEFKNQLAKPEGIYNIWTVITTHAEDEYEGTAIINGVHSLNRLGYIITENSWMEGDEIVVTDD